MICTGSGFIENVPHVSHSKHLLPPRSNVGPLVGVAVLVASVPVRSALSGVEHVHVRHAALDVLEELPAGTAVDIAVGEATGIPEGLDLSVVQLSLIPVSLVGEVEPVLVGWDERFSRLHEYRRLVDVLVRIGHAYVIARSLSLGKSTQRAQLTTEVKGGI